MNSKQSHFPSLRRWLDRVQPSESVVLGGAALTVGLTSGVGVWLFMQLIDLAHRLTYDDLGGVLGTIGPWLIALVPVVGGLVVGLLLHFFVGEERHHGVAGIMEAVALAGSRYAIGVFKRRRSPPPSRSGRAHLSGPKIPRFRLAPI